MFKNRVKFFHIGPQKCATTWLYKCLLEHPEVCCGDSDSIHYFDMFFNIWDIDQYHEKFSFSGKDQVALDMTPSYIRSPWAPKRIHKYNSDAKIILCMRNPTKRAFSHYWHEKKKEKYRFGFDEFLENYDLFSSWIEPGFYARHIEKYLEYFPREQILVQIFDDLKKSPEDFWIEVLEFMNVDASFKPEKLTKKVNEAGTRGSFPDVLLRPRLLLQKANNIGEKKFPKFWDGLELRSRIETITKSEYEQGVPEEIKEKLLDIYLPEIERVEKLLEVDLSGWK
jgi:hypothetical protein